MTCPEAIDRALPAGDKGNLISVTDPLSRTTHRSFDATGRLTAQTDPLGDTTKYTYDNLNNLTSTTNALGGQNSSTYDGNGNLTSATDANGDTTSYTYDDQDRLSARTDALSRGESYSYDGNGNLTQFTDRRGKVTVYSYDHLNRRTFAGFGHSGSTNESAVTYTYDGGNRLTEAVDSVTGTITRSYDALDRLTEETTPQGTVDYAYDAGNRRMSMTVEGQTEVDYTYDNANRLTQITQGTPTISFSYDDANRRTSLTLPNGVTMSYSYDDASQLTEITYATSVTTLGNLTYTYDLAGRRTNMGGSLASTGLPLPVSITAYDAANELTRWGTATPTYDSDGNATSDGTNSYVWDARNHLISMNSAAASFEYDPFGRRVDKTITGAPTNFLYDEASPVQELSGTTPTANLLTGLGMDERFTRTDSLGTTNFLTDGEGSTLALTDNSANPVSSYSYDPFGNTIATGSSTNTYQYIGRENDNTGVYYYRARYYSATLQRFISEDPLGMLSVGNDLYVYSVDDPTSRFDPSGLTDITILVTRTTSTSTSTTGTIDVDAGNMGFVSTYSLEPPLTGGGPVAIPAGSYPAHVRFDSGPGLDHTAVQLDDADDRTNIEIHPGNTADDTEGCILPGLTVGPDSVGYSRAATQDINDLILNTMVSDIINGEPTTITVVITDPSNSSSPGTSGRKN